jgi:hypothetical protein
VKLKEKMAQITDLMKFTKQDWVASKPDNTDMAMYLHFWRDDELVVAVQTPLDRDIGLAAGQVGAAGFAATTMSITFESYHSELGESPNTGRPWEPHEMQYTFEAVPENREKHWVRECLTTTAHERGGGFILQSMPYVIEDWEVIWSEPLIVDSEVVGEAGGGVMYDYLQQSMAAPTIAEAIATKGKNDPMMKLISDLIDDPEQRLFHIDMATYKIMRGRNLVTSVIFFAKKGTNRALLIKDRMVGDRVLGLYEE